MSFAVSGLTHCARCGHPLDMNEHLYCKSCNDKIEKEKAEEEKVQEKEAMKAEIIGVVREDLMKEYVCINNEVKIPHLELNITRPKNSRFDEWFMELGYKVLTEYQKGNKSIMIDFVEGELE